ncbi:MAG TPA: hypothetical protein VET90_05295 [Candidatus Binatus sp.]|nr:hypothetical protein [Candidatus Binatus sp.]
MTLRRGIFRQVGGGLRDEGREAMANAGAGQLEISISRSGEYLGANDAALGLLGYSAEELRSLPFGHLSGSDAGVAAKLWRGFIDDGLPIRPNPDIRLVSRDGRRIAVRFIGTERLDAERWVSRYELLTGRAVVTNEPFVLSLLLAQWRELERRIAALDGDGLERSELEARLAEVRALYRSEQDRRTAESRGFAPG